MLGALELMSFKQRILFNVYMMNMYNILDKIRPTYLSAEIEFDDENERKNTSNSNAECKNELHAKYPISHGRRHVDYSHYYSANKSPFAACRLVDRDPSQFICENLVYLRVNTSLGSSLSLAVGSVGDSNVEYLFEMFRAMGCPSGISAAQNIHTNTRLKVLRASPMSVSILSSMLG